jgi:ribosome-associated protein
MDIVVHVQNAEERVFYALERIWRDCPQIKLPEAALAGPPSAAGSPASTGESR